MTTNYDVVVVGAGPGGATTARHLARSGLKTLLLDKSKFPRYKPCGGGLTAKVREVLDVDFAPTVEDTIAHASFAFGNEVRFPLDLTPTLGWCVMRDRFDHWLSEHAVKSGAELREESNVTEVETGAEGVQVKVGAETIRAQVLVGADGANGIVAVAMGLQKKPRVAVALEAELGVPDDSMARWRNVWHADFGAVAGGYGWIFPKADHLSVGVATLVYPERKQNMRQLLERFISREPTLQDGKVILLRGARVPIGGGNPVVHTTRVVLVGDAAGVADPFTGEGIYQAIKSGRIAADEIANCFSSGDFALTGYSKQIRRAFTEDYRYAWRLARLVYRIPRLSVRLFKRSAIVQSAMTQ